MRARSVRQHQHEPHTAQREGENKREGAREKGVVHDREVRQASFRIALCDGQSASPVTPPPPPKRARCSCGAPPVTFGKCAAAALNTGPPVFPVMPLMLLLGCFCDGK